MSKCKTIQLFICPSIYHTHIYSPLTRVCCSTILCRLPDSVFCSTRDLVSVVLLYMPSIEPYTAW